MTKAALVSAAILLSMGPGEGNAQGNRQSATSIAATIASGTSTAVSATSDSLAAIKRWSILNGVGRMNAEAALAAARAIDADRASGKPLGLLAGIPIVVKDNIQVQNLPAAAATPGLGSIVAKDHAPVLKMLVAAGAIPVATTNMHELAFGISGYNPTYQTGPSPGVRSPYDPSRFAGGSSSGTGALVGAGAVAIGLGTDTGGSVRIPAAINGIAGLRPSIGRYPQEGIVPISRTRDTAGLLAASLADIELFDRVIAGGGPAERVSLRGLRLGLAPYFLADLDADTDSVFKAALGKLKNAGVELVPVEMPGLGDINASVSFPVALYEAYDDLVAYLGKHAPGVTIENLVREIRSPDVKGTYEALVLPRKLPGPNGLVDAKPIYEAAIAKGRPALIALYAKTFAEHRIDALVFPTIPRVAVEASPQSSSLETFAGFIRNTDPGSNAGIPGLTLPIGRGATTGMPIGLELDGPAGSDRRLIAIGLALEELFGTLALPQPK